MPVRHFKELIAWRLATEFKLEAFRLLRGSPDAWRNYKYRHQVIEASPGVASNVVEGFLRKSPGDFCRFLDYSVSSLGETEVTYGTASRWRTTNTARAISSFCWAAGVSRQSSA
jgi:four helix bundle protein